MAGNVLTLKTNLAPAPVTQAIHDGRISSEIVKLDCCGPDPAQSGFKDMVRRNLYEAGELAIVTYLQAKCYNKPFVLLPAPVSGRFQHHCAGYNGELGHIAPKDIEGKRRRASPSMAGERSSPTTVRPASFSRCVKCPVPQPTSSALRASRNASTR